jgi:hypothetical protein
MDHLPQADLSGLIDSLDTWLGDELSENLVCRELLEASLLFHAAQGQSNFNRLFPTNIQIVTCG